MASTGEKIRLQRLMKNYSQEYMGFQLSISQAAYSKIERDETEITLIRIYEIAEILEISAFELMPKPKYGTSVPHTFFSKTWLSIKKFWRTKLKHRTANIPQAQIAHSDTSNSKNS